MAKAETLAEVFLTALRSLPKTQRDRILIGLVKDKGLRRDLMDLATIEERKKEPSRAFRDYLREQRGQRQREILGRNQEVGRAEMGQHEVL